MKKVLIGLILILSFSFVFAEEAQDRYEESNQLSWGYEYWQTNSNYFEILNNLSSSGNFSSHIGIATRPRIVGEYARLFLFPKDTEDFVFLKAKSDMSFFGYTDKGVFSFTKYTNAELDIPTNTCKITDLNFNSNQIQVNSNLMPLKAGLNDVLFNNQQIHKTPNNPIEHLLKKYYYMKTKVKAELYNSNNEVVKTIYPDEKQFSGSYENFVLLKPDSNSFTLNLKTRREAGDEYNLNNQSYYWNITATPIDGKCEASLLKSNTDINFEIYKYYNDTCINMNFDEASQSLSHTSDMIKFSSTTCNIGDDSTCGWTNNENQESINPKWGGGRYLSIKESALNFTYPFFHPEKVVGYCDLSYYGGEMERGKNCSFIENSLFYNTTIGNFQFTQQPNFSVKYNLSIVSNTNNAIGLISTNNSIPSFPTRKEILDRGYAKGNYQIKLIVEANDILCTDGTKNNKINQTKDFRVVKGNQWHNQTKKILQLHVKDGQDIADY